MKGSFSKAKDVIEEELHTNTSGTTLTFGSVLRCNTKFGSVLSAEVPLVNGTVFLTPLSVSSERMLEKETTKRLQKATILLCPAPAHRCVEFK